MEKLICELEQVLLSLIERHGELRAAAEAAQQAMRKLDAAALDKASRRQEEARARVTALEKTRQTLVAQIGRMLQLRGPVNLVQLADALPLRRVRLLELRKRLRAAADTVRMGTAVTGRVAQALLGHFNTVLRHLAGAGGGGGLYTASGPAMGRRIGAMEATA